jgi:hypothetical protein
MTAGDHASSAEVEQVVVCHVSFVTGQKQNCLFDVMGLSSVVYAYLHILRHCSACGPEAFVTDAT